MAVPSNLTASSLRETASWIRDELDILVAREGPNELNPDDVLTIHSILLALQHYPISLWTLRFSRIHLAIVDICGKATRWPTKLVDEADRVIAHFEKCHGKLKDIKVPIFERGGRLFGVCDAGDLTRDALMRRFASCNQSFVDDTRAYAHGNLGFKPGQWWINGMFAFRDGIINSACTAGGVCFDANGAYAIVMKGVDEITSTGSPLAFTYKCSPADRGRYRLTGARIASRCPIRILRSHHLCSPWAPSAGLRYDGLYRIVGWACKPTKVPDQDDSNGAIPLDYIIHFEREDDVPFRECLKHPCAEELDDYKACRASCKAKRDAEKQGAQTLEARRHTQYELQKKRPSGRNFLGIGNTGRVSSEEPGMNLNIMTIKAKVDAGKALVCAPRRLSSSYSPDPQSPSTGLHDRVLSLEAVAEPGVHRNNTANAATNMPSRRTLDGSADEPDLPDHPAASHTRRHSDFQHSDNIEYSIPSITSSVDLDTAAVEQHVRIWDSLFGPVDWKRRHRCLGTLTLPPDLEVIPDETDAARARGDFETARARAPRPENATAFLMAQNRVWGDLSEAEYVDLPVVKEM